MGTLECLIEGGWSLSVLSCYHPLESNAFSKTLILSRNKMIPQGQDETKETKDQQ